MERKIEDFVAYGGRNSDYTVKYITKLLDKNPKYPPHVLDILLSIRSHAEEDYQQFLALQSFLSAKDSRQKPEEMMVDSGSTIPIRTENRIESDVAISQEPKTAETFRLEEKQAQNAGSQQPMGTGDDLFLLEGVEGGGAVVGGGGHNQQQQQSQDPSPTSPTSYSDGEGEESDGDEGIHLPRKHHRIKEVEIASSLPVRIPLPEQLQQNNRDRRELSEEVSAEEQNIAASIQAMARSVATSTMFGDPMFDVPRPRVNTLSKI
eukprot:TRINITY_DN9564_c0_g1_i2.p1 TRINITY_DN9564_c0_g1~~TRINITY_DN9564_c0_g1_i2.p1  ORF type:complete len:263 (+),score=74.12 TRINITY_DN9564_c0_g1_i2:29-817(+)